MVFTASPTEPPPDGNTPPPPSASFGKLAKRIASMASNLLAIALVLVLMLTLGREVIGWWRADEETTASAAAVQQGESSTADNDRILVGAGKSASPLELQRALGTREQAVAALARMGLVPSSKLAAASLPAVAAAEQRLLERCRNAKPCAQAHGASAYEVPGELPLVVVVRDDRVVFCGIGLAAGDDAWSLYGLPLTATHDDALADTIPLPPGASHVLSLANSAPASTLVFSGPGPVESMRQHYQQWFREQGWQALHGWRQQGESWQASYTRPTTPAAQVALQLTPDREREHWTGLLIFTTSPTHITE